MHIHNPLNSYLKLINYQKKKKAGPSDLTLITEDQGKNKNQVNIRSVQSKTFI